jgi:YidC/Oxa1 family membrane protein insertase
VLQEGVPVQQRERANVVNPLAWISRLVAICICAACICAVTGPVLPFAAAEDAAVDSRVTEQAVPAASAASEQAPGQAEQDGAGKQELAAEAADEQIEPAPSALMAAEVPQRREYVLENERLRVVVSDLRGAIQEIALRDVSMQELPTWRGGFGADTDRSKPLPVVSTDFNEVQLRTDIAYPAVFLTDLISYVWRVNGLEEATKAGWVIEQAGVDQLVARGESDVFNFAWAYRLDPELPRVHVRLQFRNVSDRVETLTPQVRALNGIWQDDRQGDAYDICAFAHFGGAEENDLETYYFPAFGAKDDSFTTDIQQCQPDYVGLKSRFFASWFTPGPVQIRKPGEAEDAPINIENFGPVAKVGGHLSGFTERRIGKDPAFPQDFQQAAIDMYWYAPTGQALQLQPGETLSINYSITATDVAKSKLEGGNFTSIEKEIEYTDSWYWFFRPLSNTLNWFLSSLTSLTGSAGIAILLVTLLVKLTLYWPTFKQRSSMLKMQKLAPEMKRIQEQYKNDRQTAAMKTMELYRKHKVNPAGGCLPILIQMPIFIALYQAFRHSADLRGEGFMWIADLTQPDQLMYFFSIFSFPVTLEPILIAYVLAQLWMVRSHQIPEGASEQQVQMAKMMRWMPVIFVFFFYIWSMPAGLVLYFTWSAILGRLEFIWIDRKLKAAGLK